VLLIVLIDLMLVVVVFQSVHKLFYFRVLVNFEGSTIQQHLEPFVFTSPVTQMLFILNCNIIYQVFFTCPRIIHVNLFFSVTL